MLKKTALILGWCFLTILTLFISFTSILELSQTANLDQTDKAMVSEIKPANNSYSMYMSLPNIAGEVQAQVKTADARAEILRQYLLKRNSPLAPYADLIVNMSDLNGIDFRLPVAIAECESNLCQDGKYPENSFNCWGYGIHSAGTLKFASFEEGITKVIAGLKKFKDMGYLTSIYKLMELYTPPSLEKGGSWAKCVTHFMDVLQ
ncbi:MAG: hypothetical protein M1120_03820 [Patescibacteria group bacterium]|nr:hypothetical protein [Patescibacteria group bacterium]